MYTIYADNANQVSINCLKCGLEQDVDITKLKGAQKKLMGKCKCGEPYEFTIEFRNRYREDVRLPGEYIIPGIEKKEEIIVRELSFTGIQFESLKPHNISKDDLLEIKFNLDNNRRSKIRKLVKVIWVKDHIIGAHFIETKLYEKDLGLYLQV